MAVIMQQRPTRQASARRKAAAQLQSPSKPSSSELGMDSAADRDQPHDEQPETEAEASNADETRSRSQEASESSCRGGRRPPHAHLVPA